LQDTLLWMDKIQNVFMQTPDVNYGLGDVSRFTTNKCLNDTNTVQYNGLWAGLKSHSKRSKCEKLGQLTLQHTQAQSGQVVKVKWVYLETETTVNNTNYYCGCDIAHIRNASDTAATRHGNRTFWSI